VDILLAATNLHPRYHRYSPDAEEIDPAVAQRMAEMSCKDYLPYVIDPVPPAEQPCLGQSANPLTLFCVTGLLLLVF
jgi:hypothetical protein